MEDIETPPASQTALENGVSMARLPRRATARVVTSLSLIAAFGFAGPAAASGGNSNAPAPASPAPVYLDCFGDFGDPTIPNMTAPDVAVNYAGDAGCVGVRVSGSTLRLAWVVLADGWTYVIKSNGEGSNSRVQLQFTHTATRRKVDFRFELGKTAIG
jgi:hypothetical protein